MLLVARVGNIGRKMPGCLHRAGFQVDVLSIGPKTPGLRRSSFVRRFDAIDTRGSVVPEAQEVGRWVAENEPLRRRVAVLGDDVPCHEVLHGDAPDVRSPVFAPTSPARLDAVYDTWCFHGLVADVPGVRVPGAALVPARESDAATIAAAIGYPLLVKPLTGEGGHGIARVGDLRRLQADLVARDAHEFQVKLERFIGGTRRGKASPMH